MSQEKVERRKEYKKNRKTILAKEKRIKRIKKVICYLCLVVLVGGIGYSFYKKVNPTPVADTSTFYNLIATDSYGLLTPTLPE